MTVVAFLQNMWVLERQVHSVSRWDPTSDQRERMIHYALFAGCKTGRVLRSALGEPLCDRIKWQEASPVIANNPRDYFPPDAEHIRAVLAKHKPEVVLSFTRAGEATIREVVGNSAKVISCLHPASRNSNAVLESLRAARLEIEKL